MKSAVGPRSRLPREVSTFLLVHDEYEQLVDWLDFMLRLRLFNSSVCLSIFAKFEFFTTFLLFALPILLLFFTTRLWRIESVLTMSRTSRNCGQRRQVPVLVGINPLPDTLPFTQGNILNHQLFTQGNI